MRKALIVRRTFSGITETEGREQPFTVWFRGQTVYFASSRFAAENKLKDEEIHYKVSHP